MMYSLLKKEYAYTLALALVLIVPMSTSAIYYNPGDTLDPACTPSPTCTVNMGYAIGTSTATSSLSGGIFYTTGGDVIQQSGNFAFDDASDILTLGGSMSFVSTSTPAYTADTIYNDNGVLYWNGLPFGTVGGSGTSTQVAYWDGTSVVTSTSSLVWTAALDRLSLNTASPTSTVMDVVVRPSDGLGGVTIQSNGTSIPTLLMLGGTFNHPRFRLMPERFEHNSSGFGTTNIDFSDPLFFPKIRLNKSFTSFFDGQLVIGSTSSAAAGGLLTVASNGTAALPAIALGNQLPADSDTGFFKPGADIIGITTGGVERMRVGGIEGNISIATQIMDYGLYDKLIVGGSSATNAGITILNDINASLRIGRYSALVPNSYFVMSSSSLRYAWSNATDTDIMHLSSDGGLLIGPDLASTSDALATIHLLGTTSTSSLLRLENFAGQIDMFVATGTPNALISGAAGDIAFVASTTGTFYIKRPSTASVSGWAEILNASTTCALDGAFACQLGNASSSANVVLGTNDAFSIIFETNNTDRASISSVGDFSLTDATGRYRIGNDAVLWHNGDTSNIFAGVGAGSLLTTGGDNTFIGNNAGAVTTLGSDNVAVGADALGSNTTGSSSVAVGSGSLALNTSGSDNIGIGIDALSQNVIGLRNIGIGHEALRDATAEDNIAIGWSAMRLTTTGTSSIAIGSNALSANTTGNNNLVIGASALSSNVSGSFNIAIGSNALLSNTIGTTSIAVGHNALMSVTDIGGNIGIGTNAQRNTTSGLYNIAIGHNGLMQNTTGTSSIALGVHALSDAVASNNIGMGYRALASTTSGTFNIAAGFGALEMNTTGSGNIGFGWYALASSTASNNLALGLKALAVNSVGTSNLAMGAGALASSTSGSGNFAIGSSSLASNLTGANNFALGMSTLRLSTSTSDNFAIGVQNLQNDISLGGNFAVGSGALSLVTTGTNNFALGTGVLRTVTGSSNFAIGGGSVATFNVATSSSDNFAIGTNAFAAAISSINMTQNLGIGASALGGAALVGGQNTAIGRTALNVTTSGDRNLAIGASTLLANTTGRDNLAIGLTALDTNTIGNANVAVGVNALTALGAGSGNVAFGYNALDANTSSFNIGLGVDALGAVTTGSSNIAIGNQVGTTTTIGAGNILIGYGATTTAAATNNFMNIGNTLLGFTNSGSQLIGIRQYAPAVSLHVGSTAFADTTVLIRTEDANSTCDFDAQAGAPACGSDARLKKDIVDSPYGLSELVRLRPVTYHWKAEDNDEEKHTGFIAQEVRDILPEFVSEREDGILLLSMGAMMPVVVQSIQEVDERIETLEQRILSGEFAIETTGVSVTTYESLIVHGELSVLGALVLSTDSAGDVTIPEGTQEAHIVFDGVYAFAPVVTLSASEMLAGYYVSARTETGFTIRLAENAQSDVALSWHAFIPNGALTVSVSDETEVVEDAGIEEGSTEEENGTEGTPEDVPFGTDEASPEAPPEEVLPEEVPLPAVEEEVVPEETLVEESGGGDVEPEAQPEETPVEETLPTETP